MNLERMRRKAVLAAERESGLRDDGTYKLGDGLVRVSVTFYLGTKWWVEDLTGPGGQAVAGTRRRLDDETRSKLKGARP